MKYSFCARVQTETRRLTCLILIVASLIASSACRQAPGGAPAAAAPCEVALAAHSGDAKIDREIARLQQEIRSNAKPFQTTAMIEKLGWSFVEKARESFDPGFYKLAEQCAICLESKQDEDRRGGQSADRPLSTPQSIRSAALLLRGHALHNLHRQEDRPPHGPGDDARPRSRSAEQPGQRHPLLQRRRQRREPGAQRRRDGGRTGQIYPAIDLYLPQRLHGVRRTAR